MTDLSKALHFRFIQGISVQIIVLIMRELGMLSYQRIIFGGKWALSATSMMFLVVGRTASRKTTSR